jgi:hypothetical protein
MAWLLRDVLPTSLPSPFLHIVGICFAATLPVTAVAVLAIRLTWRRGKGMYDL